MKILDLQQDTPEWLKARNNKIGASDALIIMGVSPWSTPFKLWQQKLGLIPLDEMNDRMRRGKELEPYALKEFNAIMNLNCKSVVAVSDELDYVMASFDGYDLDKNIALEIKCPGPESHEQALRGEIPDIYYPQLQQQMYVSGLESMYYFSYDGKENALLKVVKDVKFIDSLLIELNKFWNCLQNLESPKLTDKDFIQRNDGPWIDTVLEWKQVNQDIKTLTIKEKTLRTKIIELAGRSSTQGAGIKLSRIIQKGRVIYESIPELINVDLDKYRGEPIETFRITEC